MTKSRNLTAEQLSAIKRKAGKRASELGVSHVFTAEQAREAAKKSAASRAANSMAALGAIASEFDSSEQMRVAAKRFQDHRSRAVERGIAFEFTFMQWWRVWKESGRWDERGRKRADSYVMARPGDKGPYSVGNVYITTLSQNFIESWRTSPGRMNHRRKHNAPVGSQPQH